MCADQSTSSLCKARVIFYYFKTSEQVFIFWGINPKRSKDLQIFFRTLFQCKGDNKNKDWHSDNRRDNLRTNPKKYRGSRYNSGKDSQNGRAKPEKWTTPKSEVDVELWPKTINNTLYLLNTVIRKQEDSLKIFSFTNQKSRICVYLVSIHS